MGPVSEGTRVVMMAGCRPLTLAAAVLTAGLQPGDGGSPPKRVGILSWHLGFAGLRGEEDTA